MTKLTINTEQFIRGACEGINKKAAGRLVLCAVSGGVNSAVCAALAERAVGGRLVCLYVDTGLSDAAEGDWVDSLFRKNLSVNLIRADAKERFLTKLKDITEPEQKKAAVAEEFVRVFEDEAYKLGGVGCLIRGTIHPEAIETGGDGHKRVNAGNDIGALRENVFFDTLCEPLRTLHRADVRECGAALGLPEELLAGA